MKKTTTIAKNLEIKSPIGEKKKKKRNTHFALFFEVIFHYVIIANRIKIINV